jgi:hypothetical protein
VTGRRLVPQDELQTEPVQFGVQGVHILIAQNHGVRQLPIALQEGMQSPSQRLLVQRHHFQHSGANEVDVVLQQRF